MSSVSAAKKSVRRSVSEFSKFCYTYKSLRRDTGTLLCRSFISFGQKLETEKACLPNNPWFGLRSNMLCEIYFQVFESISSYAKNKWTLSRKGRYFYKTDRWSIRSKMTVGTFVSGSEFSWNFPDRPFRRLRFVLSAGILSHPFKYSFPVLVLRCSLINKAKWISFLVHRAKNLLIFHSE